MFLIISGIAKVQIMKFDDQIKHSYSKISLMNVVYMYKLIWLIWILKSKSSEESNTLHRCIASFSEVGGYPMSSHH